MAYSVLEIARPTRRRLKRIVQKSRDKDEARRALAILQLWACAGCVSAVARALYAARSSVNRWRALYEECGEAGITVKPRGRSDWKATDTVLEVLGRLVRETPRVYGYLRSRWSSELLGQELAKQSGTAVHATTIRRWLARLALVWRRARPTLCIRDPQKSARLRAIEAALGGTTCGTEVFYVDEADINLNPKIGQAWMPQGEQTAVPTPGKNQKRYIAGALHARTGRVVWVQGERKSSLLFINLLYWLKRTYRSARRIVLIADNYIVHKSTTTLRWLARNPKFTVLFQPAYHPWVNRIERLWKALHDTVTRNHRFHSLEPLMAAVARFLEVCQPFPGNRHGLATA